VAKLILLSIVIVGIVVPIAFSTRRRPRKVLRLVQVVSLGFVLVWAYLCITWYPQLVPLD
jgi:hypothetical protein